ncbi:hypothetical protein ACOMHN_002152 [Nucella lapillus]
MYGYDDVVCLSLIYSSLGAAVQAVQWDNSTDVPLIHICTGDSLFFPWSFRLQPGELLEDIKWLLFPGKPGSTPDLLANYIYGHFIPMPAFADRLVYSGDGDLRLDSVGPADGGRYEIEVVTTNQGGGNGFVSVRRHVVPPGFPVSAQQCHPGDGGLKAPGHPHRHTPSDGGQAEQETLLDLNHHLTQQLTHTTDKLTQTDAMLSNVQQEVRGLRSCCGMKDPLTTRMSPQNNPSTTYSPPRVVSTQPERASPSHFESSSQEESTQETTTSWSHEVTKAEHHTHVTHGHPTRTKRQATGPKEDLNQMWQNLTEHINALESKFQQYQAPTSHRRYNDNDHVIFNEEKLLNECAAFDQSSGEFVAPVSGVYVLMASTSAVGMFGASSDADLMVDSRAVARMLGKYTGNYSHVVFHLHKGQRAWVRSIGVTSIDIRSLFTGFLLKADC